MSPRESLATPAERAAFVAVHAHALLHRVLGPHATPHDRAAAEDALQDLLHDLSRPRSWAPDRPDALLGFAVRTLRLRHDALLDEQAATPVVPLATAARTDGVAPDPAELLAARSEALTQVRDALERLPSPRARRIALLHLVAGDRRAVAASVGATPRAVRTWVERFRLALREEGRSLG